MSDEIPFPIIGIGASAGGLEAVREMLAEADPAPGMAFVLVQHLDPNHESMMAELIDRRTSLPVTQIEGGETIERDHVYVIPPGHQLRVDDGRLDLVPFSEPRGLRRPIDDFLISLAEDQGPRVCAVILSGTGADGSSGLRAIKEQGGLVVVQDPETARYDGMPSAAIGTGLTDFTLPPEKMLRRIEGYFERRRTNAGTRRAATVVAEHVDEMCDRLAEVVGHDFSGYKKPSVIRRIERRMQVLAVERPADYLARLNEDGDECHALLQDILINVTSFFRDPPAFEVLMDEAIRPMVRAAVPGTPLRVWVPGCSSGEEAFTIAMLIAEACEEEERRPRVQVFGTDIDQRMLAIAREGRYPLTSIKDVPDPYRDKYLIGLDGGLQISPRVRDMVQFSAHSVIKDPPFSRLDLVSCRNMLIYMDNDLQSVFVPLMHYAIREGGHLFLGPSEGIGRAENLFQPVHQKARLFRRRPGPSSYPVGFTGRRDLPVTAQRRGAGDGRGDAPSIDRDLPLAVERVIERYAPPHVVVDDLGNILSSRGKLAKFLEFPSGQSAMHVVGLAHRGLSDVLGPLLRRATDKGARVSVRDVQVSSELGTQTADVAVDPCPDGTFLIVLSEVGAFRAEVADDTVDVAEADDRLRDLEDELRHTRHRLRETVQELETANEELKSSNEEMMSMNEELQSANEELSTVNEELKHKIDELSVANTDMRNFVDSTRIGLVVLDADARVRSFTRPVTEVFPLQDGDRGRPLADVASLVDDDAIVTDARAVVAGGEPVERVVAARDGARTLAMRILPYVADGRTDGATLTFADVTDLTHVQRDLERQTERLHLALSAGGMGVWDYDVATGEANIDATVRGLLNITQADEPFSVDAFFGKIVPDDVPAVSAAIEAAEAGARDYRATFRVPVDPDAPEGDVRWVSAAGRLRLGPDGVEHMTGVNFDVTAERRGQEAREFLLREINHRVKNLFAIIPALLSLAAREAGSIGELVADVRGRIAALGRAHEVTQGFSTRDHDPDRPGEVGLGQLVSTVLGPYVGEGEDGGSAIELHDGGVRVPIDAVTPFGLILHEWATNSAKYGALARNGSVTVHCGHDAGDPSLRWRERIDDAGGRGPEHRTGFGSRLVDHSARQLGAEVGIEWHGDGIELTLRMGGPRASVAAPAPPPSPPPRPSPQDGPAARTIAS